MTIDRNPLELTAGQPVLAPEKESAAELEPDPLQLRPTDRHRMEPPMASSSRASRVFSGMTRFLSSEEIARLHRVLDAEDGRGYRAQADIRRISVSTG